MPRDAAPRQAICNIEAEQALLGAVLLTPECLDRLGFLRPEHFYEPLHADIFRLARQWHEEGRHVSPVTLRAPLGDHAGLKELGGTEYLARLAAATISLAAVRDYGETLLDLYSRREIVSAADKAATLAQDFTECADASAALTALDGDLDAIRGATQRRASAVPFSRALTSAMERMVAARDEGPATPTGLASLDQKIGGLFAGDMLLIGGRPSMGKTAVALSLARRIARRGRAVIFASLEMQSADLAIRLASEELRARGTTVPYEAVRKGRVTDDEAEAIMRTAHDMERLPIEIIESHVRRLPHLQAEIRRLVRKLRAQGREIGGVFIDYLGLIDHQVPGNDNSRVSQISAALKGIAGEHKLPLVVLSQLNRGVESREDKRPQMSDLRDSGSLEQDADAIIFTFRPEYYEERSEPDPVDYEKHAAWQIKMDRCRGRLDLIVAKQRMGPVGAVTLRCDLATNSIWDAAP